MPTDTPLINGSVNKLSFSILEKKMLKGKVELIILMKHSDISKPSKNERKQELLFKELAIRIIILLC